MAKAPATPIIIPSIAFIAEAPLLDLVVAKLLPSSIDLVVANGGRSTL